MNYSRTAEPFETSAGKRINVFVKDEQGNQIGSGFVGLVGTPEEVTASIDAEASRLASIHEASLKVEAEKAVEKAAQTALLAALGAELTQPKPVVVKEPVTPEEPAQDELAEQQANELST